jgi:hypothetical protein
VKKTVFSALKSADKQNKLKITADLGRIRRGFFFPILFSSFSFALLVKLFVIPLSHRKS